MSDAKTTPSPKLNTFVKLALTDPAFRRALLNAGGKTDTSQEWKDMSKQLTKNRIFDPNVPADAALLKKCLEEIVAIDWTPIHEMEIRLGRAPEPGEHRHPFSA